MSWSSPSADVSLVVMFLTECKLKPADAIAGAKGFLQAGFTTRDKLLAMTEEEVKQCMKAAPQRKKVLKYLASNPPPELPTPPAKKAKTASGSPFTTDAPAIARLPAESCTAVVVSVNRSPVMILWAAVVAQLKLKYDWNESLSLASAVAALNARAKGISIGTRKEESALHNMAADSAAVQGIFLLGREVPARREPAGHVRGVSETGVSIAPSSVYSYLSNAFKANLPAAYSACCILADSVSEEELAKKERGRNAYVLYEQFRPDVAQGVAGWGAKAEFELIRVIKLVHPEGLSEQSGTPIKEEAARTPLIDRIRQEVTSRGSSPVTALHTMGDAQQVQSCIEELQMNGEAYIKNSSVIAL